jgi:hypothetical protein
MSRNYVLPWLLAATLFVAGSGASYALTSVEELKDVNSSHWAYEALSDLVEKYDVIEGYPDYTFRGNRAPTRWEMAAALNALIKSVGRDLARLGAEKADKSDLMKLARLQEEFKNELAALNARTDALESRAAAIEAKNNEQDTRLDLLERTQLHGDLSFGVLADFSGVGNETNKGTGLGTTEDGIQDGLSAVGRVRLGVKVPVVQDYDNSRVGEGDVIARLVGAFGRFAPQASNSNNFGTISGYSAIAGDQSYNNEGFRTGSLNQGSIGRGLNTRQNVYIESAYFKQHFKSGIPVISNWGFGQDNEKFKMTSDLYLGVMPWRNLFNRSPYKGDELNQFQNTALVNNPGMLVNNVGPTIAHSWHQGLGEHFSMDLTGGVQTINSADALGGLTLTEELNLNYDTSFLGQKFTKPGNIYVGGYHVFFDGNTNPVTVSAVTGSGAPAGGLLNRNLVTPAFLVANRNDTLNAFYAGMNQEWWRGIGTSVDFVMNQSGTQNAILNSLRNGTGANFMLNTTGQIVGIQHALSAVATVPLTVFKQDLTKRAKDVWGIGYSWIQPTALAGENGPRASRIINNGGEHVFESFYRFAVNDSVTVVPSVQVILNRYGVTSNGPTVLFGLRTNYVF